MTKTKIVIADDHALIRVGLANFIKTNKNYQLLGEASNGKDALDLIFDLRPDIAILDIDMPIMDGLKVCEEVKKEKLSTKVLLVTMLKELEVYKHAMQSGASGYLLKDNTLEELDIAISTIKGGNIYVGSNIEKHLTTTKSHLITDTQIAEKIIALTKTEKDILLLIASNLSSKEIAMKLFVAEKTIKNHRHNIIEKLNLDKDQNSLLKFAFEYRDYLK